MTHAPYLPPQTLLDLLRDKQRFWLATHVNPDADGIGSMLGLGLALTAAGKEVRMLAEGHGPSAFGVLPGYDQIVPLAELDGDCEVIILFDCHELSRIGSYAEKLNGEEIVAVIDHHLTDGEDGGDGHIEWLEPAAASTASLVHSIVHTAPELTLSPEVASCCYSGLITDTGGFRFSNTTADTLKVGADLVECGADAAALAETFLHRRTPGVLRLLARVLDTFDYRFGGRVVFARMTLAMCEETGGRMADTEGFVNFATSAEGVRLVALLKEESPTRWRISLRANDPHDVQRVAAQLGGGGHAKAAGCTLDGDVDAVEARLTEALGAELERGGQDT